MAYHDICSAGFTTTNHKQSVVKAPYAYKAATWVGYDDPDSLVHKVNKIVKEFHLGGIFMWTLDFDDFTGSRCGQGKYPLLRAVAMELELEGGSTTPTAPPTVPTVPPTKPVLPCKKKKCCRPVGLYAKQVGMKKWCVDNCALGNCPASHCTCADPEEEDESAKKCEAVGAWRGNEGTKNWCLTNCAFTPPNCPPSMCGRGCLPGK